MLECLTRWWYLFFARPSPAPAAARSPSPAPPTSPFGAPVPVTPSESESDPEPEAEAEPVPVRRSLFRLSSPLAPRPVPAFDAADDLTVRGLPVPHPPSPSPPARVRFLDGVDGGNRTFGTRGRRPASESPPTPRWDFDATPPFCGCETQNPEAPPDR